MENEIGFSKKEEWDEKWKEIFENYQQDLRNAYYVNSVLDDQDNKILEIAAGSFRDMAYLNSINIDCFGTDYSSISVKLAKQQFPELKDKIFQSDAFAMETIQDKAFDVTYHNGFWVLFNDDNMIHKIAKEQARITKKKMIVTVHNKHNTDFINYFKRLSIKDNLYKIRFFELEEIVDLMKTVCKSVTVIPVGKGKKYHEDNMINEGLGSRNLLKEYFEKTKLDNLLNSERLMCVGYL